MNPNTQQLVMDVMDGNPGALLIIRRLMYFAPWHLLLHHLKGQGLTGSRLWQVVKDDYGHVWTQFAHDQLAQICQGDQQEIDAAKLRAAYRYN
ncbi:hypothetical protein [Candidatus Entotheonella palauensis]|nr:hypothetical protein [Candidatus Entotheonella palauensis]